MNNKAIIIATGASNKCHKDCRLIYLTPEVKTSKQAHQLSCQKPAETTPNQEIQLSRLVTAMQRLFFLTRPK